MARYLVIARFTDHHKVYEPGEYIEWDGVPSRAFRPVEPEKKPEPAAEQEPTPELKRRGRPPKR